MSSRIKYFSRDDLACGSYLKRIETMFSLVTVSDTDEVNDIIEMYNIGLYFQNECRLIAWKDKEYSEYKARAATLCPIIAKYFNSITDDNIVQIVGALDHVYYDDFWALFESYKIYNQISLGVFVSLLPQTIAGVWGILQQKNTVRKFGDIIKNFLLSFEKAAEIVLSARRKNRNGHTIFLPCLSADNINDIFLDYINGEDPNPDYLQAITETKHEIPPKTKLIAKQKRETIISRLSAAHPPIRVDVKINFVPNLADEVSFDHKDFQTLMRYNLTWIEENLDPPTLLNNFIYLFGFVDFQMRSMHTNLRSKMGEFERVFCLSSEEQYPQGISFKHNEAIAMVQMHGYYEILQKKGKRIESIIEWFFKEYLSSEFGASEFIISMPSENRSYIEKCTDIVVAIDSLIRQFSLFVKYGELNPDLMQFTSGIKFKDIPSFVADKYAYGSGTCFNKATHLLFSNQCMLSYVERVVDKYASFMDMLRNERISISDYTKNDQANIQWLVDQGILRLDDEGFITIQGEYMVYVLEDLYKNEVINVRRNNSREIKEIELLHKKEYIRYESSLLSDPEVSLFNYYLNQAEFTNGLDIRNKYAHGVLQTSDNQEEHRNNYNTLLRLFILLIIKINDDFCLKESIDANTDALRSQ